MQDVGVRRVVGAARPGLAGEAQRISLRKLFGRHAQALGHGHAVVSNDLGMQPVHVRPEAVDLVELLQHLVADGAA